MLSLLSVVLLGWTLWVLRGTWLDTGKLADISKIQAKEMKDQTNISTTQVSDAREAMRVSNRPYVEIGQPDGKPIAEWVTNPSGEKIGVRIYFQNAGNTPATRFWVNGGSNPKDYVHLTPKAVQFKDIDSVTDWDALTDIDRLTIWVPGSPIAAHAVQAVQVERLQKDQIAALFKMEDGKGAHIYGDFEYFNIFDEYCCDSFTLIWRDGGFSYLAGFPSRKSVCAPNIPNICRPSGEPD